jgi:ATP-binding cassette, subfamily B, bacterial
MIAGPTWGMRRIGDDAQITTQQIKPGTVRRILPYAMQDRGAIVALLVLTMLDAAITAVTPLLLGLIIDSGILHHKMGVVVQLSLTVGGLAVLDAVALYFQSWYSARIGEGLVYELRTSLFAHVQRQPLAFFTRTQTGSLVNRMNNDVNEAQSAVTLVLSQAASVILTLLLVLAAMFYLSWQITLASMVLIPVFIYPGKLIGKRLQRLARQGFQVGAELATMTTERCSVPGAMLAKLYGQPELETSEFTHRAAQIRDLEIVSAVTGRSFSIATALVAALTTALVYGVGGALSIHHLLQIGTLVAMIALITRLYAQVNSLSGLQLNILTALVAFDRVFEVLDLKPLITEQPSAHPLPASATENGAAPEVEFDAVSFRYPAASEISLPSLERFIPPTPERTGDDLVLSNVSFRAPAGKLTALVGPSGAGKTTITHLVPRLYDPSSGTVRIGGQDIRDLTLKSLHSTIGVVPQDAHLFHDTIRANLTYARPEATEDEVIEACKAARIWDLIDSLPDGLDTVAGDHGYRLSGGEKQRVALARLLLKAPKVVVLDEATAHLDSESEAAIQRALKTALGGRTSLVIAHRLSTIREADQILVIDDGQIRERGTHQELLSAGGLYADLYHTQFAAQEEVGTPVAASPAGG